MTIGELINKLMEYPKDAVVVLDGYTNEEYEPDTVRPFRKVGGKTEAVKIE